MEPNVVSRTSILLGAQAEGLSQQLLDNHLISNWQRLAPTMVNTTRILIIVNGLEPDYIDALNAVKAAAENVHVAWRNEDFLTYGDPNNSTWIPPLAIPPNYVVLPAQPA
jgi:hypothetical protein